MCSSQCFLWDVRSFCSFVVLLVGSQKGNVLLLRSQKGNVDVLLVGSQEGERCKCNFVLFLLGSSHAGLTSRSLFKRSKYRKVCFQRNKVLGAMFYPITTSTKRWCGTLVGFFRYQSLAPPTRFDAPYFIATACTFLIACCSSLLIPCFFFLFEGDRWCLFCRHLHRRNDTNAICMSFSFASC